MYRAILVDDEPLILEGLAKAIDWEGNGYEIVAMKTNPLEALDYIANHHIHLLVTDVSMPQMSGTQLIQKAKEINPLLSVVVISAFDRFEYVRAALKYGAENYLLKPVDPDELGETVRQLAGNMLEREQLAKYYGANMLPFHFNFTENWLKRTLPGNELRTRAGILGINHEAEAFTCVIFTSPEQNTEHVSYFYDYLNTAVKGLFRLNYYFETQSRLVCVFSPRSGQTPDLHGFLQKSLEWANLTGLDIFACAGQTEQEFSKAPASYENAHSLLFFQYTAQRLISYADFTLPQAILEEVQQNLKNTHEDDYLESVRGLFFAQEVEPYVLAARITAWCLQTHGADSADFFERFPQFAALSKKFPVPDANLDEDSFYEFCTEAVREAYRLFSGVQSSMYPCVDAVIKMVHEFSDKDLSLKTLAAGLNVSPSYLGNAFKQQTGYYFNEYLTDARLNYAAELIQNSDMKMKDIVDRVGFSSQTYFNRTFKRKFDLSPVAFRRKPKS